MFSHHRERRAITTRPTTSTINARPEAITTHFDGHAKPRLRYVELDMGFALMSISVERILRITSKSIKLMVAFVQSVPVRSSGFDGK